MQLHSGAYRREFNKMMKTAELTKMIHTVLRQRAAHATEMGALRARMRRQEVLYEEKERSLEMTLRKYKHVIKKERHASAQELQAAKMSVAVVVRVNAQLEDNNKLLCEKISRLERQVLELESKAVVADVLLAHQGVKRAIEEKERQRQSIENMQAVALKRAFSYYSPIRRRRQKKNKKKAVRSRGMDSGESGRALIERRRLPSILGKNITETTDAMMGGSAFVPSTVALFDSRAANHKVEEGGVVNHPARRHGSDMGSK
jgi:hypothetical protein